MEVKVMDITEINFNNEKLSIFGVKANSEIESYIADHLGWEMMFNDDYQGVVLANNSVFLHIIRSSVITMLNLNGFSPHQSSNSVSLGSSVVHFVNYKRENLSVGKKVNCFYIHHFDNDIGVCNNLSKIEKMSDSLIISTLDFPESIIYDENIDEKYKTVVGN